MIRSEHRFVATESAGEVSGLLVRPDPARALLVLAHGAGAGMRHVFLEAVAEGFASRRIATFRYQFPYLERGSRRPDFPPVLARTVRAAVDAASGLAPDLPVFAGGKSMGGRMTSAAAGKEPLPGVRGLVFLGFPLHPAGHPGTERADHLASVGVPMLFLQGTRDKLAELPLLEPIVTRLGATMHVEEGADHSFAVLKRSGRTDEEVRAGVLDVATAWMEEHT